MDNYLAVGIAEGFEEAESEDQVIEAWQHLVDTGLAWTLQGETANFCSRKLPRMKRGSRTECPSLHLRRRLLQLL